MYSSTDQNAARQHMDLNAQGEIDETISDIDMDDDISDSDSTDTGARTISAPPEDIPGRWVHWSKEQRLQHELLFADQDIIKSPWNGWHDAEAKLLAKDEQMLEYLADFPCEKWLLGTEVSVPAYKALMRRCHLRDQGFHAFPLHIPEDFWPPSLRSDPAPPAQPQHLKPSPRAQAAEQERYQPAPPTSFEAATQPVDVPGAHYTWSDGPPPAVLELAALQQQPPQPRSDALTTVDDASTTRKSSRAKKSPPKSPDQNSEKGSEDKREARVSK